jgi:hypothetical protein
MVKHSSSTFRLTGEVSECHIPNAVCMRCNAPNAKYLASVLAGRLTFCGTCLALSQKQEANRMEKALKHVFVKKKKKRKSYGQTVSGGGLNGTGTRSR